MFGLVWENKDCSSHPTRHALVWHWTARGILAGLSRCEKRVQTRCYARTPQLRRTKKAPQEREEFSPFRENFQDFQPTPLSPPKARVSLGSKHTVQSEVSGGRPRCNARAGLLAVRTVDSALTSSWDDGLWRGLPRKWRGHLVRLPRAFTALTLHHQVDRELAKYEARRLLYVNGLRSARR